MIFDIERLIKAADLRDERLQKDLQERLDKVDQKIHEITVRDEAGRKEMLARAEKLVETLRVRVVSKSELSTWFAGKRGEALAGTPMAIRHLHIERDRHIEKHQREALIGKVQADLRVLLEQGQTQISGGGLQQLGYWNDFKMWMERYNDKQRRPRPADPED